MRTSYRSQKYIASFAVWGAGGWGLILQGKFRVKCLKANSLNKSKITVKKSQFFLITGEFLGKKTNKKND